MTDNMHNEMFDYLKSFMIENYWYNHHTSQQARSIFTTICMMGNIDADTEPCNNMLYELWQCASIYELKIDYNEFEDFMIAWIV